MTDNTGAPPKQADASMKPPANKVGAKPNPAGGAPMVKPGPRPPAKQARPGGPPARKGPPKQRLYQTKARFQTRHLMLILSFVALVALPSLYATWYLHFRAADQYASNLAFTIQSDDSPSLSSLGAIFGGDGGGVADDSEVLYGFIQSQNLVELLQDELDLRTRFNRRADEDWYFSLGDDPSIEALVEYWQSMARVATDAGIVEVEIRAFTPEDAQIIAKAVLRESTLLINRLSEEAREDAVRDARDFLDRMREEVRDVRARIADLRGRDQIVDPTLDVQIAMQQLGQFEASLADERRKLDQLREFAGRDDSRVVSTRRNIQSLETAIAEQRAKLASSEGETTTLSSSVGRFEELMTDKDLAEQAYAVALASFERAKQEARRQQRYLSAHIPPTLSQTPEYPERYLLGSLVFTFLFLGWVVLVMIAYNIKDRR